LPKRKLQRMRQGKVTPMKYDDLLRKILELTNIQEDPNVYIQNIHGLAIYTATVKLMKELPSSQIDELLQEGENTDFSKQENVSRIYKYFPKDKVDRTIQNTYGQLINEFIQEVTPNLDQDTQDRITMLVESYVPTEEV